MGPETPNHPGRPTPQIDPAPASVLESPTCAHCGEPAPRWGDAGPNFCCAGCAAAYHLIGKLDLAAYYARRAIDPKVRPLKPDEDAPAIDYAAHATGDGGERTLNLMVEGLHCAACVWLIESVLAKAPGVTWARVNMTTRRLVLKWRSGAADANDLVGRVAALGYRLVPYDPARLGAATSAAEKRLLRALAVAGFAAGNIMLLSVAVWAGTDMSPATRDLMHWISALIAVPAVGYAGMPFFHSAAAAVRAGRVNMDVPIALAVLLATGMSLWETVQGGVHVYFDSAAALLFFLLIGRYLDSRARGRARSAAEHLLALSGRPVTVVAGDGRTRTITPDQAVPGMTVLVAAGERIGVDGRIVDGASDLDTGLIDGESVPRAVAPGDPVHAGMVNLSAPLRLTVTAAGEATLLAEIVRMMEAAEQGRAGYVHLADRVARFYAPVVHLLALATFLGWVAIGDAPWQTALLYAVAVLVITCPCALALAVPAVQVIACGRLLRRGVLLKTATALERLARVDRVVFDKTGTLTEGRLDPVGLDRVAAADRRLAASMALASRHPLARALVRATPLAAVAQGVREVPGSGLALATPAGEIRLGNRAFCGIADGPRPGGPEFWLRKPGSAALRFAFADRLRRDAAATLGRLRDRNVAVTILSGDRAEVVAPLARDLGVDDWAAACDPADKVRRIEAMRKGGDTVLMVGDGLNDAPALAAADVSMSPGTAADISQVAADAVFQGDRLEPVLETLDVARRAARLVRQNLAFAFAYNAVTVPLAVAGLATPLVAAIAMSASSLIVVGNALRLAREDAR
jgi:Cu2+-exporting ATPase